MVAVLGFSKAEIRQAVEDMYTVVALEPETDLHFPTLAVNLGENPIAMERVGLGVWNVIPVNVDEQGYMLLSIPEGEEDELGTSVFFQTNKGLTADLVAAILLKIARKSAGRFMTPEGMMVTPVVLHAEPQIEGQTTAQIIEF